MNRLKGVLILCVVSIALGSIAYAQNAVINWVHMKTGDPLPAGALLGGEDYDSHIGASHMPMYVCRVNLHGGIHPGKLLNNNCNVSWGGSGTEYHDFEVAVRTGGQGHWAAFNPADTVNILLGGHEANGEPLYVCHANYIHKTGGIGPILKGDHDSGIHPGKLKGPTCWVEWGSHEFHLDSYVQVFYRTPPPPPPVPPCGIPGKPACTPAPTVNNCSIPPHLMACGTVLAPQQYPGQSSSCSVGYHGVCVPEVCASTSFTFPRIYCAPGKQQ